MKNLITLALGFLAVSMPAYAADWTSAPAAAAADQLAYQADAIKEPGKFPRALYTDYSIPLVAYHLEREPKDFYPQIELRKHPDLSNFMTVRDRKSVV